MPNVLFAAVFFGCGIAISSATPFQPVAWLVPALILAALTFAVLSRVSFTRTIAAPLIRSMLIALSIFFLGGYHNASLRSKLTHDRSVLIDSTVQSIHATVSNYRSVGSYYTRLGVRLDSLCAGLDGSSCQAITSGSAVLVFADSILAERLFPGVQIRVNGKLSAVQAARNPGTFDYGKYLTRQGYVAELKVTDTRSLIVDAKTLAHPSFVVRAQRAIRANIRTHIPADHAKAMIVALTLGDRSGIDESIQDSFRNTGLMHLLAVSGLHVLVVGYSVYRLLGGFLLRIGVGWRTTERLRSAATLGILLFYYFVAGQSVSIFRALIMATIFLVQHVLKRRAVMLNGLGVAAMVVLFVNPADLFSVGFQLSFSAVASLALLNPLPERPVVPNAWIRRVPRRLRSGLTSSIRSIASSFAATVGTMPILVYHFGFVSFAGIVLNVAAIPVTASALSSGILSVLSATLGLTALADWLGASASFFTSLLVELTQLGNHLFDVAGFAISPPGTLMSGFLLSTLMFYATRRKKRIRWKLTIVTYALTMFSFFLQLLKDAPALEILFLDVGQGDAILIVSPERRTMLIDTGPPPYRDGATSETISAALQNWHLKSINILVHSHPHADHIGGSADVLEHIPVEQVIDNGIAPKTDTYLAFDSVATIQDIAREVAVPTRVINLSTTTTVEILAPNRSLLESTNLNNSSVVLRVVFGQTCALMTGDIEFAAEVDLVAHYQSGLECAVVKIPHHGSNTSSMSGLVGRAVPSRSLTQTSYAIVSVAIKNRFGLPDREALDRWSSHGSIVRSTQQGAVWLKSDGLKFWEFDWRGDE